MQMIEFASTQKVSGDSKEIGLALLLLLFFALVASGYVLKKGLEKGDRTTHELLLKFFVPNEFRTQNIFLHYIITSVVPRGLPLQMALAVNTALMSLTKAGLFCTEPFRVPYAGKVSHCLFDKTGTITTDTLSPVGVVGKAKQKSGEFDVSKCPRKTSPVPESSAEAALVLASCHSLVKVKDVGMVGDPIELAALKGVQWQFNADTNTATPGTTINLKKHNIPRNSAVSSSKILHRYHFSSKLQRMSVVCKVEGRQNGLSSGKYCLVKGSPEALRSLLAEGAAPSWYDESYRHLAEHGMRVLALAYKQCAKGECGTEGGDGPSREWVESNLHFAGFIAFTCMIRKDSRIVIGSLRESDHSVAMITGDAPLTALHVAKEVGICRDNNVLSKIGTDSYSSLVLTVDKRISVPFNALGIPELAKHNNLVVTEKKSGGTLWDHVDAIQVFARMSPQGKAKIMQRRKGHHVLMCGDGGNDVGALKQADVGLALLSGAGSRRFKTFPGGKQKEMLEEELARLAAEGQTVKNEMQMESRRLGSKNNVYKADSGNPMDALGMLPVVRPGDASVAAPFTSRTPTIRTVVDIIRQGRCTLLSALQQQQIMYVFIIHSNFNFSERQLMASSWLIMIASLAFSYATPVDKMHRTRPLHSLFHPTIFISMIGQACIHLYSISDSSESDITDVTADPFADIMFMWSRPFMPNLMNTVVFLVETSSIVAVLFVNYKGRPWMKGTIENHALFLSPYVNGLIHLEPFPDDAFRFHVMYLVSLALVGTFVWDRFCTWVFSPDIFSAMMESAKATTLSDLMPVFMTFIKVFGGLLIFCSGNIFVWGGCAFMYWRRRKAAAAELLSSTSENVTKSTSTGSKNVSSASSTSSGLRYRGKR
eukprot:GSMAST32.ASY1.ANO1.386.1 assembled CDS